MIGRDGQQAHEIPVTMRSGPACQSNAQRVDRINALRWPDAGDFFPLESLIAVQLVPRQLADFVEGVQGCVALGLLQRQQLVLKHRVVQVEPDTGFIARHAEDA